MARLLRERLSTLALAALFLAPGCLTYTPGGDDDDATDPGDDDDSTDPGDDDDSTDPGDDDDSTDPGDDDDSTEEDVPLEAMGTVTLVVAADLVTQVPEGGAAVAVFSDDVIGPSVEEAAFEDVLGFPIGTFADPGDFRESAGQAYDPAYLTGQQDITLEGALGDVDLQPASTGWGASELDGSLFPAGTDWTARIDAGPFLGGHTAPLIPEPPTLEAARLLGDRLYIHPTFTTTLELTEPPAGVDQVVNLLTGFDGQGLSARVYRPGADEKVDFSGLENLDEGSNAQLFVHRTRRELLDVDGRSLLMASTWLATVSVYGLGALDRYLAPVQTPSWMDPAGTSVNLTVEPADLDPGEAYTVQFNGPHDDVSATYSNGQLAFQVDPAEVGYGWSTLQVPLPSGGVAHGSIQIGGEPPGCDVYEGSSNDTFADADSASFGQVICGTFDPAGDEDVLRFETTLGASYRLEVFARRLGSIADSVVTVYDAAGTEIAYNDDWFDRDSRVVASVTEAGPVFVQLRDFAQAAGPDAWWRLVTTTTP